MIIRKKLSFVRGVSLNCDWTDIYYGSEAFNILRSLWTLSKFKTVKQIVGSLMRAKKLLHKQEMQQPQRFIPSVSDLYGTDEIDLLLDEIKDLEPACYQFDDIQDFEIAGSRADEISIPNELESPLGTVTSWDSHIHYRNHMNQTPLPWGVALHCHAKHFKSPTGIVRILLVLSSAACLVTECSAGTVQVGLFLLPLLGRLRLMMFSALFSILITCLLLFLDVSAIALMFPFNWGKVNTYIYLCVGMLFLISSTLILHTVLFAEAFVWVPKYTKDTLFISAMIGYVCALEALALTIMAYFTITKYCQVPNEDEADLVFDQGRELSPMSAHSNHHDYLHKTDIVDKNVDGYVLSNHTNCNKTILSSPVCNQTPYIPEQRPNQANNRRPTLGHIQNQRPNTRYRQGYHYQPVASTSQLSPTFVFGPSSQSNFNSCA